MKSINGFNNSSLQGSSNLSALNSIGTGVDIAKTAMSNDVNFQTSTGGTSYSLPLPTYYGETFKEFDCIVQKWQDPENPEAEPEYRLKCVVGLTSFENYNVDEQGFIKNDEFIWNHRLSLWNVWPTGTSYIDEDDESQTFLDNGYILLQKNKNYKIFIYKVNPSIDNWPESLSAQIAIIEEGSPADTNVKSKYNGGGSMQAYIVSESTTVDNIVTADPFTGKIAELDPGELNEFIEINLDLLNIVRSQGQGVNHPDRYPNGMSDWLGSDFVPVFANPEDMTVDDVLTGPLENNIIGSGENYVESSWVQIYTNYAGEFTDNVIVGKDVGTDFGYTANPIVSGLLNVNDFTIVELNDEIPASDIFGFNSGELDIIASNPSTGVIAATVEVPTGKLKGNVGFSEFDCARKEIAYIKWVASDPANPSAGGRFDVYQINNGPINFNYKPILNNIKKVATQGEAHWGTTNDSWVSPNIVEFSYWGNVDGYLSELKYKENSSDIGGFLPVKATRTSG